MATTVTIKSVDLNNEYRDQNGLPKVKHIITYTNAGGKEVTKHVFPFQPLFEKLQTTGKHLTPGLQVDTAYGEPDDKGFRPLVEIAKAGTLTAAQAGKRTWTGLKNSSSFKKAVVNPDKELSMEISGLMQAIISKEGLTGLKQKTLEVYQIKKELMAVAKTATSVLKTETAVVEEAELHEQKTQAVVSYKIDDDESPF